MSEPAYRIIAQGVIGFVHAMEWRVGCRGGRALGSFGPLVLASNHVGHLDPVLVGYAVYAHHRRLTHFLGVRELFDHPLYGLPLRITHQIPVHRDTDPGPAVDEGVAALAAGRVIGAFPEGSMNPTLVPGPGKTGAARMAMRAGAPLVPAAIWGSQRLSTRERPRRLPRGVPVTIDFGEPIRYAAGDDPRAVTDRLMAAISGLVERAAHTYPESPADAADRWWLPAHLGGTAPPPEA